MSTAYDPPPPIPPNLTDYSPVTFCTDEDLYEEVGDDYFRLVADSRTLALGQDGQILAVSPWVLTSVSNNFATQGIQTGDMFRLGGAKGSPAASAFGIMTYGWIYRDGDAGRAASVFSISANSVTLQEPGATTPTEGVPLVSSDTTGIVFRSATLRRQIALASNRVRQDLNFDIESDIISIEDIREATVNLTLAQRYRARATFVGSSKDDFNEKSKVYQNFYNVLIARLQERRRSLYPVDDISIVPLDPYAPE